MHKSMDSLPLSITFQIDPLNMGVPFELKNVKTLTNILTAGEKVSFKVTWKEKEKKGNDLKKHALKFFMEQRKLCTEESR